MRRGHLNTNAVIDNMKYVIMAILAAILYGISSPVSKLLLAQIPATLMAALLYLGAGIGMLIVNGVQRLSHKAKIEAGLTRRELPYVVAMIILDIGAPILLMFGLTLSTPATVSLLNNFEIVSTSLIAFFIFKEAIGKRMVIAITLITLASIILSVAKISSITFSPGAILVLFACICWGLENNCTRMLSVKDPMQIVVIKGFGSGIGALLISFVSGQYRSNLKYMLAACVLGFVAYGLSIYFYILAQRGLGAARTSAYYAATPFIGVGISWMVFHNGITLSFLIALSIMLLGSYLALSEVHTHLHTHTEITHEHKHKHPEEHHTHAHIPGFIGEHSHQHTHESMLHEHSHTPDAHHNHSHS
jgi:drug/metabolite transporter (DMT)-like permease